MSDPNEYKLSFRSLLGRRCYSTRFSWHSNEKNTTSGYQSAHVTALKHEKLVDR